MFLQFNRLALKATLADSNIISSDNIFTDGCNVILTQNNSKGKSSIINGLMIGLGMDAFVGKSSVVVFSSNDGLYNGDKKENITSGSLLLEIRNKDGNIITIRREKKKTQVILKVPLKFILVI